MFQALFWALSGTPFSYLPYNTPSRLKIKAFPFPRAFTAYDMYLSSHTRGIPKKSGPSDQFRTYSGPLLALRSGSGLSPEFRTLVVPLIIGSLMLRNSKSLVVLIFGISLSVVFASCRSFPGFPPKMNRNCQSGRSASPAKTELLYILH